MGITEIYSKRKKLIERANQPEIYQYTDLPIEFRRQVIHIWLSAIGDYRLSLVSRLWHQIHDSIARELGLYENKS